MKYSFKEIIDPLSINSNGNNILKKVLPWQVEELENYYSWNVKLHRYDQLNGVHHLENIDILLLDLNKYGSDPHVHYHLG